MFAILHVFIYLTGEEKSFLKFEKFGISIFLQIYVYVMHRTYNKATLEVGSPPLCYMILS